MGSFRADGSLEVMGVFGVKVYGRVMGAHVLVHVPLLVGLWLRVYWGFMVCSGAQDGLGSRVYF